MVRRVNISGMSEEVRRFFQELSSERDAYLVVEEQGQPLAGVVPSWQVGRLEAQREELLAMLREVWERNKDVSHEEIEREVEEAIQELRQESRR